MISLNLPLNFSSIFSKIFKFNLFSITQTKKPKNLPIGIQTFEIMINERLVYIDKTEYIYKILTTEKCVFYAHPRRFGKSLLVSTMQAIFENKRELFKGLWIDSSDYKWQNYPVIKIDFSEIKSLSHETLDRSLIASLTDTMKYYNVNVENVSSASEFFRALIVELSKLNKVVILVDEYDDPLLKYILDQKKAEEVRTFLSGFYKVIKTQSDKLHFVFLTGVSKFSQVSIFSGLNNLCDISYKKDYAQMLGYTKPEIEKAFCDYIKIACEEINLTHDELMDELEKWYFGYQFCGDQNLQVFSPFSIILFFQNLRFSNFWFATGTPTFLLKMMEEKNYELLNFDNISMSETSFNACSFESIEFVPLLLQTGYLTIENYDYKLKRFKLRLPTLEVKESFICNILSHFTKTPLDDSLTAAASIEIAFEENNLEEFFKLMKSYFANIPYSTMVSDREKFYQSLFFGLLYLVGVKIICEDQTNLGRIDMVVQTKTHIYLFEFKVNKTSKKAIKQIEDKKYFEKYLNQNSNKNQKEIILIGVNFNAERRNIENWIIKKLENK